MSEGPSIRRTVTSRVLDEGEGEKLNLEISIQELDENFKPKGAATTFNSSAVRRSWKRRVRNEPQGEATFHFNMRRQLANSYSWRYELHATLSDPLN